jgi:predicted O-methyltransferase YrrM
MSLFQFRAFFPFYRRAVTQYQVYSPFVFELVRAVLEDHRRYYAFYDVEALRGNMLKSDLAITMTDYGSGGVKGQVKRRSLRSIAQQSGSSARQGRMLFRLARHFQPKTLLELGTSAGLSTLYLAAATQGARFTSLEGSVELAQVAKTHLEYLQLSEGVSIRTGPFEQSLEPVLKDLQSLDFVYFDGNHRLAPTLEYVEKCLKYAHDRSVFVFDDTHWSAEMEAAWAQIKQHPRVTLSVDFFTLSLVFFNPDFKEKQHYCIVPAHWKPWKFY